MSVLYRFFDCAIDGNSELIWWELRGNSCAPYVKQWIWSTIEFDEKVCCMWINVLFVNSSRFHVSACEHYRLITTVLQGLVLIFILLTAQSQPLRSFYSHCSSASEFWWKVQENEMNSQTWVIKLDDPFTSAEIICSQKRHAITLTRQWKPKHTR